MKVKLIFRIQIYQREKNTKCYQFALLCHIGITKGRISKTGGDIESSSDNSRRKVFQNPVFVLSEFNTR